MKPGSFFYGDEEDLPEDYILNDSGRVGKLKLCTKCPFEERCQTCDGEEMLVNWGKGWEPYRD